MPSRIIREDYLTSEAVDKLTADEECFFVRLMLKADDHGRFSANLKLLKSALYPLKDGVRDTDIARKLAAAEQAGVVRCYEVDGKRYLVIPKFRQRSRSLSKYPDPPDGWESDDGHMTVKCPSNDGLGVVVVEVGGVGGKARAGGGEIPERQAAIDQTAVAGVDPSFAGYVYDDWAGRDGKDGAGISVKWLNYCTKRWNREREEWAAGTHKGRQKNGHKESPTAARIRLEAEERALSDQLHYEHDRQANPDKVARLKTVKAQLKGLQA